MLILGSFIDKGSILSTVKARTQEHWTERGTEINHRKWQITIKAWSTVTWSTNVYGFGHTASATEYASFSSSTVLTCRPSNQL